MADQEKRMEKETGEAYKNIGKLLSESMAQGISAGSGKTKDALEKLNQQLLDSEKNFLAEKKRIQQENDAAEEEKRRRDYQIRLQKAKTAEQAEIIRQNERLRLQKKANDDYLASLDEHLKSVQEAIQAERALIKEQKIQITNEFDEIARRAAGSLQELNRARNEMAEKMEDYGGLFTEQTLIFRNSGRNGNKEVFKNLLPDLSLKRKELERYAALLGEVQNRADIPEELFQAIRGLSISDAIRYQEALLALNERDFKSYLEDWGAIRALSQETADQSFAKDTRQALEEVERELEAWYGTIPEGFLSEGELSAEAFGKAFVKKLESMKEMLQEAVSSVISGSVVQGEVLGSAKGGGTVNNVQSSMTYVLNSSGETVAQQLRSAQAHAEIAKLRGDYSGVVL